MIRTLRTFSLLAASIGLSIASASQPDSTPPSKSFNPQDRCAGKFAHQKGGPICIQARWVQIPISPGVAPDGKVGEIELIWTQKGKPVALASLKEPPHVWIFMPEMGHGSMPVKLEFPKSTDPANILRVQDMIFSMPGTWEIRVSLPSLHGKPKDLVALTTEIKE